MKPSLLRRLAGALAITLASAAPAAADNFPSKPITFVVPFAPGAGTDQLARGMAQAMQASFPGATVVVENKPGAGGIIAAQAAARAAPVTSHRNPATDFRRNPASGRGADEHLGGAQGWLGFAGTATERFDEVGAIFGAR